MVVDLEDFEDEKKRPNFRVEGIPAGAGGGVFAALVVEEVRGGRCADVGSGGKGEVGGCVQGREEERFTAITHCP